MNWLQEMIKLSQAGKPFTLVTVIETSGSAPREIGARMIVTMEGSIDTIGGGNLEFHAIELARKLLSTETSNRKDEFFGLGVTMSQCCGGAVRLLYESFSESESAILAKNLSSVVDWSSTFLASPVVAPANTRSRILFHPEAKETLPSAVHSAVKGLTKVSGAGSKLAKQGKEEWFVSRLDEEPIDLLVFGAGHAGKALVKALQDLPFRIHWIDERNDMFPKKIPANTTVQVVEHSLDALNILQPGTFYVIMTHNHGLDYELCLRILHDGSFGWLGLIGSKTKRIRFENRFKEKGIDGSVLKRLVCPIGLPNLPGKSPAVIAASVTTQLLQARQQVLDAQLQNRAD